MMMDPNGFAMIPELAESNHHDEQKVQALALLIGVYDFYIIGYTKCNVILGKQMRLNRRIYKYLLSVRQPNHDFHLPSLRDYFVFIEEEGKERATDSLIGQNVRRRRIVR
jgi:hypothetical protein